MDATQAFQKAYNSQPNFMTPEILARARSGRFFTELSRGEGFDREPIFGVTVLEHRPNTTQPLRKRGDLNFLFPTRARAEEWISQLAERDTEEV